MEAGCLLFVFGCCSEIQGRGRQMFREKWFLHHLVSSFVVVVRSATNQQLQAERFTSNEAPAKRGFSPVGSNDSVPKDHASSGRCQTCLAWKSQLSMESATSLGRSNSPWSVFCCRCLHVWNCRYLQLARGVREKQNPVCCVVFFMYLT